MLETNFSHTLFARKKFTILCADGGGGSKTTAKDILFLTVLIVYLNIHPSFTFSPFNSFRKHSLVGAFTAWEEEIPWNPGGGNYNNKTASIKTAGIISETSATNFSQLSGSLHPTCKVPLFHW